MADDIDRTNDREYSLQHLVEQSRRVASSSRKREITPSGICYECEELVAQPKLFCDTDCRDMYEKRKKIAIINNTW